MNSKDSNLEYLGEDVVYNFNNGMIDENKYSIDAMKKYFNEEIVMTKIDDEYFENSTRCWICGKNYLDDDAEVRDHCFITGKFRGSADRDCNIKVKS